METFTIIHQDGGGYKDKGGQTAVKMRPNPCIYHITGIIHFLPCAEGRDALRLLNFPLWMEGKMARKFNEEFLSSTWIFEGISPMFLLFFVRF